MLVSIITALTLSLIYANYVLYAHIGQLAAVRDKYRQCIERLVHAGCQSDEDSPDDDHKESDQSFVVLNRAPAYLKESTVDFFKDQSLESVLDKINMDEWIEYTDKPVHQLTLPAMPTRKITTTTKRQINTPRTSSKTGLFGWPIKLGSFWLSSLFGPRTKKNGAMGFHMGIDMAAPKGTIVRAAAAGRVVEVKQTLRGQAKGYGNTVVIDHGKGFKTRYAHLDVMYVREGQYVDTHKVIGKVGETGYIRKRGRDGSHLHFEIYDNGKRVNPLLYLPSYSV